MKKGILVKIACILLCFFILLCGSVSDKGMKANAAETKPELLITEVVPKSSDTNDCYEFIEIYNNSSRAIDMKDYKFMYPQLDITGTAVVQPGGIIVFGLNSQTADNFKNFYNVDIDAGKYVPLAGGSNLLDNSSSEYVILASDDNRVICAAEYNNLQFSTKKSISYKFPESGVFMRSYNIMDTPTPGRIDKEQISGTTVPVSDINILTNYHKLDAGKSVRLNAAVLPVNATNKQIIWSSSNSLIAAVDASGLVTAKAEGIAVITASAADGGLYDNCIIEVVKAVDKYIPVSELKLNKEYTVLREYETERLTSRIVPDNATNRQIVWSSSDTSVCRVDNSGLVTAVSEGTAYITAKAAKENVSQRCIVIVKHNDGVIVSGKIRLNKNFMVLKKNRSEKLQVTFSQVGAADRNVVWTSSDSSVAAVDSTGKVTAKKYGAAVIKASTTDGKYSSVCIVAVTNSGKLRSFELEFQINSYFRLFDEYK